MAVRASGVATQDGPQDVERAGNDPDASDFDRLVRLAEDLHARFTSRGITLATAESCTGGLVGHLLTEVSGSSAYFVGGAVTYSDALKRSMLDVPEATLSAHGAVSAQTAVAMADGARTRLGADVGVAVTGIAGPTGATPGKPVGLTYVAVADARGHDVRRYNWTGDRASNKLQSAAAALELVAERLGPDAMNGTAEEK